ncbi:MAG: HAD hydrolase family protein, partial [Clostridia bacterium]|nr:HAD hydrolase family protein [Clostridia bacterium]
MGIFENCLLACDVDGTLICENTIPKDNIEAIEFFIKEGGHFALCTGRSVDALKQVFSFLDKRLAGISIVLGGGMLYDFVSDSIVSQSILSDNDKYFSKYVKENLSNIGIEIHLDGVVNVLNRTDETDIHEEYEKLYCEFKSFEEINHLHWNKVLYALKNEAEREVLLN